MADGEDWIMRPVLAGLCSYESLLGGAIKMVDLARMNAALDVRDENDFRGRPKPER